MSADELRALVLACAEVNTELEARLQAEVRHAGDQVRIKISRQLFTIIAVLALVVSVGLGAGIAFKEVAAGVSDGLYARMQHLSEVVASGGLSAIGSLTLALFVVLPRFGPDGWRRMSKILRRPSVALLLLPEYKHLRQAIFASLGLACVGEVTRLNIAYPSTGPQRVVYSVLESANPVFLGLGIGFSLVLFGAVLTPEPKPLPAKPTPVDFN